MAKINLGNKARDKVSGFEGICVARTEWLNGCWRLTLQPQGVDKDGKPQDSHTFDEFQLQFVDFGLSAGSKDTGGPRDEPVRARDPV